MWKQFVKENSKVFTFFFPFYPTKVFRSTRSMLAIASLLALKIILTFVSIPLKAFGLSISFAWVPIMIMGWFYGPIVGIFLGAVSDTLCYFIASGGIWFWMYAIQEPIVCFLSGIFAGIYNYRVRLDKKSVTFDLIFNQITIFIFGIFSYVILLFWLKPGQNFSHKDETAEEFYVIYKWSVLAFLTMFFVIIEVMFYINVKHKKTHKELMLFCYSSSLVITIVLLFSFLLGPITAVQYLYYLNGHLPNNYLEYGTIFYLIPRVCVESVKAPAECALTATVLYIVEPNIKMIHNNTLNKWPSVNK